MEDVKSEYALIEWAYKEIQSLGEKHNIEDIFQDAKLLPILLIMNLKVLPGRIGNDAIDDNGNEYEIKTTSCKNFSTSHHVNKSILDKFRKVWWIFGVYEKCSLTELYLMNGYELDYYFDKWEMVLEDKPHLNNPKIPLKFVREFGGKVDIERFKNE